VDTLGLHFRRDYNHIEPAATPAVDARMDAVAESLALIAAQLGVLVGDMRVVREGDRAQVAAVPQYVSIPPPAPTTPYTMPMSTTAMMGYVRDTFSLMSGVEIRDTVVHLPSLLVDMTQAVDWSFNVSNACNQEVTLQMLGNVSQDTGSTGTLAPTVTVSANSSDVLSVEVGRYWTPYIGMSASYAVAPSSGALTIAMTRRIWAV